MVAQTLGGRVLTCSRVWSASRGRKRKRRTYTFDSCGGGAVLEDDTELGELAVDLEEVRKEPRLGVEDAATL